MSQHWYDHDGTPRYKVPYADPKKGMRDTTLTDARKHKFVPSTTTLLDILDKPPLTNWKVKQGILAALTLPRYENETDDIFIARVVVDSKEQAKMAAEEGERIHDACEASFKHRDYPVKYEPHVLAVRQELVRLFPHIDDWVPESTFAHRAGYGGKIDIHSPRYGTTCDYKSKEGDFGDEEKQLAYDEQLWQLSSYRHGKELPAADCANIFVSRTHPGKVASAIWKQEQIESGIEIFLAILKLWQLVKKYDSSF